MNLKKKYFQISAFQYSTTVAIQQSIVVKSPWLRSRLSGRKAHWVSINDVVLISGKRMGLPEYKGKLIEHKSCVYMGKVAG